MNASTSRREFLKLTSIAVGGAMLAACAPKPAPAPTAAPAAPAKVEPTAAPAKVEATAAPAKPAAPAKVELRLHVRTGTEQDTLAALLPELEAEKNIVTKVESFPGGEYNQKLQVLLAGDQQGDVWWNVVFTGQAPMHASKGVLMFLDDLVKADNFDLTQYYEGALATCYYEGKLFGLPFKLHPGVVGLYYNVEATEKAGLGDELKPTSWDELLEMAKKMTVKEADRTTQFGFYPAFGTTPHFYFQISRAWGGDILSADGKKALVNTEPFMKALQYFQDMAKVHGVAPLQAQVPEQPFESGVMASMQSGSWSKSLPTRVKFPVKDVLLPKGPGGKVGKWMVTDVINMGSKTKHPKEAWELVKLLCGKELGIRLGEGKGGASGTSGGRRDVFESERLLANPLHPMWLEAVSVPEDGWEAIVPANFRGGEYNTTIQQMLAPIWLGDATPDMPFLDNVNKALQEILDKPAP